jgi:hypothetical protein
MKYICKDNGRLIFQNDKNYYGYDKVNNKELYYHMSKYDQNKFEPICELKDESKKIEISVLISYLELKI